MVKVFKSYCFASKEVLPVTKEPLVICSSEDKIFVATADCELLVFEVVNGTAHELQKLATISQVEKLSYNAYKNYIATVEQKKSWKRMTHSVRVYLNWKGEDKTAMPKTKIRIAGRSHIQNESSLPGRDVMEIIELPLEKHATGLAVCSQTGNFAVACDLEVKLCSLVEKSISKSDKTYIDVETFLQLSWSFSILSIALCEEFVICCSQTQVQGVRVRYDEGIVRSARRSLTSPISLNGPPSFPSQPGPSHSPLSLYSASPKSTVSDSEVFTQITEPAKPEEEGPDVRLKLRLKSLNSVSSASTGDLSTVGRRVQATNFPRADHSLSDKPTLPVDDQALMEWDFNQSRTASCFTCLPGLHSVQSYSQCHHHFKDISAPVVTDFSGKVKSSSGIEAETVLYINDSLQKEEWMHIELVPSYTPDSKELLHVALSTDRMTSLRHPSRISVCCFISGSRSGYLYQLSPLLNRVSCYEYTNKAAKVCLGPYHLHVLTQRGVETYTTRWSAVAMECKSKEQRLMKDFEVHPPSSLDICLCGHEPFLGVADMSTGSSFLSILSKMDYASIKEKNSSSEETVWSLYIVHCQNVIDQYQDMLQFAEKVQATGPTSYIHMLQEAHLLLSAHKLHNADWSDELDRGLVTVKKLLGDVYAQPGEDNWQLCHPYYSSLSLGLDGIVKQAMETTQKMKSLEFGKGIIDHLDKVLFSKESAVPPPSQFTAEAIVEMYTNANPEALSRLILLSNLSGYRPEVALQHLTKWITVKRGGGHPLSTIDQLAMIQIHLSQCEVELACSKLDSVPKPALAEVCCSHPRLLHSEFKSFTPLGQLMRWHRPLATVEILVEMLDQDLFSLDSLLILLQSKDSSDIHNNSQVKQVLELILTDKKRSSIFEEAVNLLCEIYISLLKAKRTATSRQTVQRQQMKFSLPSGDGHFARRYGWLDELPPFHGTDSILQMCQNLEVKHVRGQKGTRVPVQQILIPKQEENEGCPCCICHENLLKLQSLLCSTHMTVSLAHRTLEILKGPEPVVGQERYSFQDLDPIWDSIQLLCIAKIDQRLATQEIVSRYPLVVTSFSSLAFHGDMAMYSHLMQCMEVVLKSFPSSQCRAREQDYVKAYKDLLNRMAETFPPTMFVELLPKDGNVYFLLPFISHNMELEDNNNLKLDIIDMGKELLSQIG